MKTNRLYEDLAWLWPLWGDPDGEYAFFCGNLIHLFRKYARREVKTLLNLCCGGGKNVYNMKKEFTVTGLDISPAMLENARVLNPECTFIQADMRDFSLPEKYDAVLVDDGIAYMTTEADLLAVFKRSYAHLHPGGVMFVGPDDTTETFTQNKSAVTLANQDTKPANIDVVFVENNYDPNPNDTVFDALMVFIIRENGQLRIEQDMHTMGLFPLATWKKLIAEAGFEIYETSYTEHDREYIEFVCVKALE